TNSYIITLHTTSPPIPYTTLFRSRTPANMKQYLSRDQYRLYKLIWDRFIASSMAPAILDTVKMDLSNNGVIFRSNGQTIKKGPRSEEHTSELQSRFDLVCRLLLEK